jgi:hypothetical protein
MTPARQLLCLLFTLGGLAALGAETPPAAKAPETVLQRLARRLKFQQAMATNKQAFFGFTFTNQIEPSQIRFQHHIVDDAGRNYKAAQYDHGNALAAADVDGDGRTDLYFTSQLGRNELWRNLGGGKFADGTARAGLEMTDQVSVGAAFADFDNDGDPDLFVTTVRHGNRLFQNQGGGRFEDVTTTAGLGYSGHSSGAVFFDFDNDGRLDLFLTNIGVFTGNDLGRGGYHIALTDAFAGHTVPERTEFSLLYHNEGGGRFKEVSRALKLRDGSWSGDATFSDLNGDGYPDLYVVNMQGDDHYYENLGGKGFVEQTAKRFPKTPWGATGVKFLDYNRDGLMDLFVTDMHSDMTQQQTEDALGFRPFYEKKKSEAYCAVQWTEEYLQGASNNLFGNAFYQNRGPGTFAEVSEPLGVETYWPWGISAGDLNADGFEDLFVTAGMGYPFRYAVNSVLLNDGGRTFFDAEFLVGVEPRAGKLETEWFTLDCSGADRTNDLCGGKSGLVAVPGARTSRSSVIFDLDDDGDLDVVTNELNDRPQVLVSNLTNRKAVHHLRVRLVGSRSNRDGLGATVTLRRAGQSWTQFHDGKSGYLAQSSLPLYFGLGDATKLDSVEVRWPSGAQQILREPALDSILVLQEPPLPEH